MIVTSTSARAAVIVGILVGCLCLLPLGTARAAEPPPGLTELWEEYPLEQPTTGPEAPLAPAPEPVQPAAPPPQVEGSGVDWWPLGVAGAGGGLLLLGAVGIALTRWRREPMPTPGDAEMPAEMPAELPAALIERARALAKEAVECDKFLEGKRDEGTWGMTGTADRDNAAAPATPSERESSHYADIGERVAGVLAAAETAAGQIREDARLSAEEILSVAKEEADDVRRQAAAYDADTRTAVDAFAAERRREAEQDVQQQLSEAETQARATRQAAEAMARQIEEDGKRRGQELREESKSVEERLTKALVGLRRMTVEIEQLLGPVAEDGESLADALKPYGQRAEDERTPRLVASQTDEA